MHVNCTTVIYLANEIYDRQIEYKILSEWDDHVFVNKQHFHREHIFLST